jgi:hypothetical protein
MAPNIGLVAELKRVSAYEYRRVELNSVKNFDLAETLVAGGWKIVSSSPFAVVLERKKG